MEFDKFKRYKWSYKWSVPVRAQPILVNWLQFYILSAQYCMDE